jgi:hypothetical protein
VDHGVGDGRADHGRVEQVNLDRLGADCPQPAGIGIGASHPRHVVPGLEQARDGLVADDAGRTGDQDLYA